MKAVWYEQNGPAEIMQFGEMPDPEPGPGEVRVRVVSSGVNPSDWKRRQGLTARIGFPRVIPHQDGAGVIDRVGAAFRSPGSASGCGCSSPSSDGPSARRRNSLSSRPGMW